MSIPEDDRGWKAVFDIIDGSAIAWSWYSFSASWKSSSSSYAPPGRTLSTSWRLTWRRKESTRWKNGLNFEEFDFWNQGRNFWRTTYSSSEVALSTVVRLLRMRDHVTREMIFSDKSMVADIAFVRLVARVDSLMALQLCWSKKLINKRCNFNPFKVGKQVIVVLTLTRN